MVSRHFGRSSPHFGWQARIVAIPGELLSDMVRLNGSVYSHRPQHHITTTIGGFQMGVPPDYLFVKSLFTINMVMVISIQPSPYKHHKFTTMNQPLGGTLKKPHMDRHVLRRKLRFALRNQASLGSFRWTGASVQRSPPGSTKRRTFMVKLVWWWIWRFIMVNRTVHNMVYIRFYY